MKISSKIQIVLLSHIRNSFGPSEMLHAKYRYYLADTFLCIICVLSRIVNRDPAPEQQQVCPCPWSAQCPSVRGRSECLWSGVSGPDIISAVKRSIGSTTGFHNHGEGPY